MNTLGSEYADSPEVAEKMDNAGKMIDWIKKNTVRINQAKFMTEEELFNKYVIGEFRYDTSKPEYAEQYEEIKKMAQGRK
ncbi:MAG: hypothetical protein GF311_03470 [Candidatus Lokiarchaeota archaeon]|nr:hypothetical protein [Candidatus Lokiarchaeota archaeon]